jgi:Class III cytochrome C family
MLPRWSEAMAQHTGVVDAYVVVARADRRLVGNTGARALLDSARADVALVVSGGGVHNVVGADALLRAAVRKTGAAYSGAGLPVPPPPALGPDPSTVSCAYCHYGVETASDTIFGQTFRHADHVVRADIACARCHSSATYFVGNGGQPDPAHGKTTVTAAACSECHHVTSSVACTTCHDRQALGSRSESVTLALHLERPGAPTSREVAFRHGAHAAVECTSCHTSRTAIATVVPCATCHDAHHRQAADCTACHGAKLITVHTVADHLACAQCHARATLELLTADRTFCLTCHVDRRAHHPSQECAPCHLQMSPTEVMARILGRKP